MVTAPVHVVALGASTAVGRGAWSSAAAVRAGIAGFCQHPYMLDSTGEAMRIAMAPWLDVNLAGIDRLEALLFPAIEEALAPLVESQGHVGQRLALVLGLAPERPGGPSDLVRQMSQRLDKRFGGLFSARALFRCGHASAAVGLEAALHKLQRDEFDACLVAGVDSYIEPEALEWLEACDQFHGAGALNNAWGFVPGEGAGAVLLARESTLAALGASASLARVLGAGVSMEPKTIKSETICIGEGLTDALRATLGALPAGALVNDVYCDMNGEPYRADEFGFAGLRVGESFVSLSDFVAPADCWGDVAAASVPLHLILAVAAGAKGYAKGDIALTWASSESGERAAVLLETRRG